MVKINLEDRLKEIIDNINKGKIDKEVTSFTDYKNKFMFFKPRVEVTIELTNGLTAKIDITDYFKENLK